MFTDKIFYSYAIITEKFLQSLKKLMVLSTKITEGHMKTFRVCEVFLCNQIYIRKTRWIKAKKIFFFKDLCPNQLSGY